ncbi:MAG: hypothetical protein KKB81_01750 [Candidatus Margulisbacteria bacterium]|nr:hypothetical protein [Candidatus Margulisiibacteriota bacterium]MBU1021640.1 hypothetical protein [Candidatus Margulisiibacteriota bacterium]MBU1728790.1 hypothetical protein [Candidatus Margulisiibacteriota bacterium]MBU1955756.1 hypothetical protein [Candidatus Margulisiibacteriota bacterium]
MSYQAAMIAGGVNQTALAKTSKAENAHNNNGISFIGSISESIQGQLAATTVVERSTIKDLGINQKEINGEEWGWPDEEDLAQEFINKIERILSQIQGFSS